MDALVASQVRRVSRQGAWNHVNVSTSISTIAYRTDMNITGRGWLLYIALYNVNDCGRLRITIDGGTPFVIGAATRYVAAYYDSGSNAARGKLLMLDLPYDVSLMIETYNENAAAQTIVTDIEYIVQ